MVTGDTRCEPVSVCRLCGNRALVFLCEDKRRPFYICNSCELISVPEQYWLSAADERARYGLHDNSILNDGYVKYLSQMADAAAVRHRPGMRVLDFGSGEDAVLCRLLNDRSVDCRAYDPLYRRGLPDGGDNGYDIIILCEVIEHVRDIKKELELINRLLQKTGVVYIRTQIYADSSIFPGWWYAQDPTHINFFSEKSLRVTATAIGRRMDTTDSPDIFIVRH